MNTYKALEIWTAQTLLNLGILFSIISALLHIGRPYFERILSRMTLRVAADMWWLIYIILRDGLLFFSILFIFLNVNLDLMAEKLSPGMRKILLPNLIGMRSETKIISPLPVEDGSSFLIGKESLSKFKVASKKRYCKIDKQFQRLYTQIVMTNGSVKYSIQ